MKTAYSPNFSMITSALEMIPMCRSEIQNLKLGDIRKNELDYCGGTTICWDEQRQMTVSDFPGGDVIFPFANPNELMWEDEMGYWWPDSALLWAEDLDTLMNMILNERERFYG